MDISALLSAGIAVVIVAALYLAWRLYRTGEKPESLGEWAVQVEAAAQWGRLAVAAAEQLYTSDQIEAGERYQHADAFLLETLPNLNADQRQMIIEASVLGLHEARVRGWLPASGSVGITPLGRPQSGPGEY